MNRQNRVGKLDSNFAVGCGLWAWNTLPLNTYISLYAITNEVLEPVTFVLAYPTVLKFVVGFFSVLYIVLLTEGSILGPCCEILE